MRIFLLAGIVALAACQPSDPAPSNGQGLAASDVADDKGAPLDAVVDPASKGSAAEVADQYASAIGAGRLGEAYGLLAPGSGPAGDGAAQFAARFKGQAKLAMTVGKAGDTIDADRSRLVEIPAALTGIDVDGTAFKVAGPIVLEVAEKSASNDVPPHWRIVRVPLPPGGTASRARS